MADMAPMDRCPVGRKGRHSLTLFVPEAETDATLCCRVCGAVRRFSSAGPLYAPRLDDLTVDEILKASQA